MNEIEVEIVYVLAIAITVLWVGDKVTRRISFLSRYNIPSSVTGGLICSFVVGLIYLAGTKVTFDLGLRDVLLLAFFSTIGLSARLKLLLEGGRMLVVLMIAAAVFLVLQDIVGIFTAWVFGVHPGYGLMAGSISFAGGHGTSITWGKLAEEHGLEGATALGLACATIGLIAGGMIGGPIARSLITRHGLQGNPEEKAHTTHPETDEKAGPVSLDGILDGLWLLAVCVGLGRAAHAGLDSLGLTLPEFLPCMFVGIILTNLMDLLKIKVSVTSIGLISDVSLQLFLAMSLMSMQLWTLASALGPILFVLTLQVALMAVFARFVIFRITGKSYDSAVMAAGFSGLGLGATPVGIANMRAVTSKFGASPAAFIVIPLVGAFFLDIANALIVQGFLATPIF